MPQAKGRGRTRVSKSLALEGSGGRPIDLACVIGHSQFLSESVSCASPIITSHRDGDNRHPLAKPGYCGPSRLREANLHHDRGPSWTVRSGPLVPALLTLLPPRHQEWRLSRWGSHSVVNSDQTKNIARIDTSIWAKSACIGAIRERKHECSSRISGMA